MPRLHGYRGDTLATDYPQPVALVSIAPRVPLPAARIGRSAIGAGGLLARLWDWIRLPRVERFRRCARCGLVLDADRENAGGWGWNPMQTCDGARGEEFGGGCWSATYRLG
jgi:hypothetical protein